MNYIIDKSTIMESQEETKEVAKTVYRIKYLKTVADAEGKEVQIVDRVQDITEDELKSQIVSHKNAIKDLEAKIAEMEKL